ncbi:hypothetical protein Tco_1116871 [Tanacetum coccineum]
MIPDALRFITLGSLDHFKVRLALFSSVFVRTSSFSVLLIMFGSEPGEMALENPQVVVISKFDMHIHTSTLTIKELKQSITDYCVPMDLHPRLPPPELTMDNLPPNFIGIYIEQLEQERRAIPDAMPWRHIDTDVRDDFPDNYNEGEADRLAEHVILLRPPPRHPLYVCGSTTACRHPELSYSIKDPNGWVLTMDDFLKLP